MHRYTLYNKICSRLLAVLLLLALALGMAPVASAAEIGGDCGDSLTWELKGDTLVLTGSGAMWDFPERDMAPWYAYREQIAAVSFPDGLTRIGDLAFYECTALTYVVIPDSVTEIGWHAFDGCSGMTMLTLGSGLQVLEDAAFRGCAKLQAIHLPQGLKQIGGQAFYRCESLAAITVPESVTMMGKSVFAYCYSLHRADIQARISVIPNWTFYGCARLQDLTLSDTVRSADMGAFGKCKALDQVEYEGAPEDQKQLEEDIRRDLEGKTFAEVTEDPVGDTSGGTSYDESGEELIQKDTQVTQTENSTISTEISTPITEDPQEERPVQVQVDVTIENESGWEETTDQLKDAVSKGDSAEVNIYVKDDSQVPADVLDAVAGKDVTVHIYNASGSSWHADGADLSSGKGGNNGSFACRRLDATEDQLALLGCAAGYRIEFLYKAQINAEVLIRLPAVHARQTATLCQVLDGKLSRLQSVVVDDQGYAHFYLGSVEPETVFLIGINMPDLKQEEVLVPENLYSDYGITERTSNIEYVITGRKSSWNMNFGQVTWILAGVMLASVVGVGVLMFALNKRKLKMGAFVYDEDEDEE